MSPRLFTQYVSPAYAGILRASQRRENAVAHYGGALRTLAPALARTDIPVMEAFTPPPMGDLTVQEAKQVWPEKVIWVNFPGNLFLEPAAVIEKYTFDLLESGAPGGRLAIGCTEDFPADHFEKTFSALGRAMAEYQGFAW